AGGGGPQGPRPRSEDERRRRLRSPPDAQRGERSFQPALGEDQVPLPVVAAPGEGPGPRAHSGQTGRAAPEDGVLTAKEELAWSGERDLHHSTSRASPPGRQRTTSTAPASRASRSTSDSWEARVSSTGFGPASRVNDTGTPRRRAAGRERMSPSVAGSR